MNPARTLAHRFRTQRTDRIRVDGAEVLSLIEFMVDSPTSVEVLVTSCRADAVEAIVVSCDNPFEIARTVPPLDWVQDHEAPTELTMTAASDSVIEVLLDPESPQVVRIWNAWLINGIRHAWVGNSGMIIDELDAPVGARRRFRIWASDGFGNPTFDDLVAVVTVADAPSSVKGIDAEDE